MQKSLVYNQHRIMKRYKNLSVCKKFVSFISMYINIIQKISRGKQEADYVMRIFHIVTIHVYSIYKANPLSGKLLKRDCFYRRL